MRAMLISLAAVAAVACSQTPATEGPSDPPAAPAPQTAEEATAQDACGASRFQHLIGAPASEIGESALPAGARIITPGAMVTQDFRPERLNIITGTDGRVGSLRCF